ncbi:MAG: SRPBCC family protein [Planctomycetota bacterium]
MKYSHHVDIDAPPAAVFHWLDDSQRVMQWLKGVEENEDLEVTPERVGSTFRQVFVENGRRMEFQGVVTGYERDRRLRVAMSGQAFDLDVDYVLEPRGAGTRLTQTSSGTFHGAWKVLGFLMLPIMKRAGTKKLMEDFGRLKALAEGS